MKRTIIHWVFPIVVVLAAASFRFALDPWLGSKITYGPFLLAIAVVVLFSGFRAAFFATVMSILVLDYLFLAPRYSFKISDPDEVSAVGLFAVISVLISCLGYAVQHAKAMAERKAEEATDLAKRLQLEGAALEAVENTVLITDRDGLIAWANPAFTKLTGYPLDEALGQNPRILKSGRQPPEFYQELWQTIRSGQTWRGELINRRKDGSFYTEGMSITPVRADGEITHFVAIKEDVTERYEAQEALKKSEFFYRQTLESIPGMVFTTRPDGYCDYQSQQWVNFTGVPMSEHLGDGWIKLLHPDDQPRAFAAWRAAVEEHAPYDLEYRVRRYDGAYEWFKILGRPIRDEAGTIVRWFGVAANIEALKRAEEALRKSEEQFRSLFESSRDCILVWDRHYDYLYANQSAIDHVGTTRDKVIGKNIRDGLGHIPEFMQLWMERIDRAFATGESFRVEDAVPVGDRVVYSESQVSPIRDAAGSVFAVGVVYRDVTERKQIEDALRQSEERFRGTFENAAVGITHTDHEGRWLDVNEKLCEMLGYRRDELVRMSFLEATHSEDRSVDWDRYVKLMQGELDGYTVEKRYVRKDGQSIWLEIHRSLQRDSAGTPLYSINIVQDITLRKQAQTALQESERNYRIVADNTYAWEFWRSPEEKGFLYVSPSCLRWTGYAAQEFIDDPGLFERIIYEDDRAAYARHRGEGNRCETEEVEFRITRRDGEVRWMSHVCGPVYDKNGRFLGIRGSNRDITETKRDQEALRAARISAERAKEAAEHANAAKDQFLAVLSHELRTPLAPVLAGISLLRRRQGAESELRELEIIERNVQLEARLIDDLLDLTRIERGKINLELKPVFICTVLERVADICRPDIDARKQHFSLEVKDGPHPVEGDASRLQQVFWNVVNNAVKFTPDGGRISVHSWREEGRVFVDVSDTGIGIEPEAATRIFSAFEQASSTVTRQFGGLGLGLAITKRLVDLHQGDISVKSDGKGRGSTFRVILPIYQAEVEAEAEEVTQKSNFSSRRILLVEDHGDTAFMMKKLLEAAGYVVDTVGDAEQAIAAIGRSEFDILISDLGLPDRSGLELIQEIRRRDENITAIALSGYGREEDARRSINAGFAAHLTKPVELDALVAVVQRLTSTG